MSHVIVDTHAHLDQPTLLEEITPVLRRARAAGVTRVVSIGVDADSSEAVARLAAAPRAADEATVFGAVGIQPNDVGQALPGDWDRIVALTTVPGVVALGETGLDRYWDHTPIAQQRDYFDRHLRLSQSTGLPFVVHMRDCEQDVLEMLREAHQRGPLNGVMHSYTGSLEGAAEAVALGMYISFAGMVTYKKSEALREVALSVPLDRLLIETDSPYLSPEPVRKIRRNEPAHVAHTAACLAALRGESLAALAAATTANAARLFAWKN
ncbi:TatD family hydrolase [Botrimarina hoheduenensis]|uniref:Putative deoxyribonuclease YcfH n=1 Tax=Botrimarina hoheduenensis TaxID=2528000 RepID=A0A5C5WC73_9BACT|nr:TatD family hydrolase [Botrimarina hoheduenensis]TWT48518.1 putative deoxyribonuclease YcfH [Botrimarina hoheduenensis]